MANLSLAKINATICGVAKQEGRFVSPATAAYYSAETDTIYVVGSNVSAYERVRRHAAYRLHVADIYAGNPGYRDVSVPGGMIGHFVPEECEQIV